MKRCPNCRRDYFDETLLYCLDDGELLVEGPGVPTLTRPLEHSGSDETPTRRFEIGDETPQTGSKRRSLIIGIAAAALVAILGFAGYWYLGRDRGGHIGSIAVLPFENQSGNADVEYLSDGITNSLINSLTKLPNLKVKGRNAVLRYKGTQADERSIGKELGVEAVVLGRFTQRGDDLTLYLSLVDPYTGVTIWGEQYDRKIQDLSALQKEITRDVSQKLQMRLSSADATNLTKNYSENAEAYRLYLKGRYFFNKRTPADFQKSKDYFQQAINLDPTYARAYSGLADFYGISAIVGDLPPKETWPKHEVLVTRALELDPDLAEAHNSLAGLKRNYYGDFAGAEAELKRAIELDPEYAEAHVHYASHLAMVGRTDEALRERRLAVELDPLSASISLRLAQLLFFFRQYPESIEQYRTTIDLDQNSPLAHDGLGNVYQQSGNHDLAIDEWTTALNLSGKPELGEKLRSEFKASGFDAAVRTIARTRLDSLNEQARLGTYIPAMRFARLHAQLGDREQTLAALDKGAVEQNALTIEILFDPIFDSVRNDPRFPAIVKKIGIPTATN